MVSHPSTQEQSKNTPNFDTHEVSHMRVTALSTPATRVLLGIFAALALTLAALVAAPSSMNPRPRPTAGSVTPPSRADHCAKRTGQLGLQRRRVGAAERRGAQGLDAVLRRQPLHHPRQRLARLAAHHHQQHTTFRGQLTALHSTATWEYFVDGQLFKTVDDGGAQPGATVDTSSSGLPSGNHTIFARWNMSTR